MASSTQSGQKGHHGVNDNGFIVIRRQLLDWEWFDDLNTLGVWIYILLETNWKDNSWHGMEIPRGSALLSYEKIAQKLKISKQSARTAIDHLKSTGEITCQSTRYGLLINVINYTKYQDRSEIGNTLLNTVSNTEVTRNQHGSNTEVTPLEQSNKETKKQSNKRFVTPTIQEIKDYISEKNYNVDAERFFNYYESNGWKVGKNPMKSWKAALATWNSNESPKPKKDSPKGVRPAEIDWSDMEEWLQKN